MGAVAEGVDCGEGLFTKLLREEEGGDDDGKDDCDECYCGAGGAIFDSGGEPVVGAPGDDGENDGPDDGGEEWAEDKSNEDEDADGEEEKGELPPWCFVAAVLHQVVAPLVGLDATFTHQNISIAFPAGST
jgi:hypothetical protein